MRRHANHNESFSSPNDTTNEKRKNRTNPLLLSSPTNKKHTKITKILLCISSLVCAYVAISTASAKKKRRIREYHQQRRQWNPNQGTLNVVAAGNRKMRQNKPNLRNVIRKPNGEVDIEREYQELEKKALKFEGGGKEDDEEEDEEEEDSEEEDEDDDELSSAEEEETKKQLLAVENIREENARENADDVESESVDKGEDDDEDGKEDEEAEDYEEDNEEEEEG